MRRHHASEPAANLADQPPGWTVGDAADVHAFGRWYPGTVVKVTGKRVTVRYTTGTAKTRDKAVERTGWNFTAPDGAHLAGPFFHIRTRRV